MRSPQRPRLTLRKDPANAHAPAPTPSDFVSGHHNPFFDLQPGTTFTTQSPDGSEVDTFVVTRQTKLIDGVVCHVIKDTALVDGEVVEKTNDYFAEDKAGNVWYFGEDTKEFENGKVVSTERNLARRRRRRATGRHHGGVAPQGDSYDQENAPGVAQDHAVVLDVNGGAITVPYGTFDHILVTEETSPLTPDEIEWKHYAEGVGFPADEGRHTLRMTTWSNWSASRSTARPMATSFLRLCRRRRVERQRRQ